MWKYCSKILLIGFALIIHFEATSQSCFSSSDVVTAAYATGGSGLYKDKILWLTWGSKDKVNYPYGRANQVLAVGDKSFASIPLGSGKYFCLEAEITAITRNSGTAGIMSYRPGEYWGDSFDDMYNIGGTGNNNQLIAGIKNGVVGADFTVSIRCKATISGVVVQIPGMVIADAESLASTENINCTAHGTWTVIEVKKNLSSGVGAYRIRKQPEASESTSRNVVRFLRGNDDNTAAIALLDFNTRAYDATNGQAVSFDVRFKGGGGTAFAIGMLTPYADLGDAPESYGSPIHLINNIVVNNDNIASVGYLNTGNGTNINVDSYNPGGLADVESNILGSTAPDPDNVPKHSVDAKGDDDSGTAGANEEDAWPLASRVFSYKSNIAPGNVFSINIPYKGAVAGSRIAAWIDFNKNGKFDPSELRTSSALNNGDGSVVLTWTVPSTYVSYVTYARIRYVHVTEQANLANPTIHLNYGEVEDFKINIIAPAMTNPMLRNKNR